MMNWAILALSVACFESPVITTTLTAPIPEATFPAYSEEFLKQNRTPTEPFPMDSSRGVVNSFAGVSVEAWGEVATNDKWPRNVLGECWNVCNDRGCDTTPVRLLFRGDVVCTPMCDGRGMCGNSCSGPMYLKVTCSGSYDGWQDRNELLAAIAEHSGEQSGWYQWWNGGWNMRSDWKATRGSAYAAIKIERIVESCSC